MVRPRAALNLATPLHKVLPSRGKTVKPWPVFGYKKVGATTPDFFVQAVAQPHIDIPEKLNVRPVAYLG